MGICRTCEIITDEAVCPNCGRVVLQNKQTQNTYKKPESEADMCNATASNQTAATAEPVRKQIRLPKIPISWIVFPVVILVLLIAYQKFKPDLFSMLPVKISTSSVMSTLHSEQTLIVLEDSGNMTRELTDPRIVNLILFDATLPGGEKTIKITYDYKVAFGIDLGSVTKENIHISGNTINLQLPKPIDISVETTNDQAKAYYGTVASPFSPNLESIKGIDPNHDDYTTQLRKNTLKNLEETGRYGELQNMAMVKAQDLISGILLKALGNGVVVTVNFS